MLRSGDRYLQDAADVEQPDPQTRGETTPLYHINGARNRGNFVASDHVE